jgi:hypothetical protein
MRLEKFCQHDGVNPHVDPQVTAYFSQRYKNHWIGYRGPVTWPLRSSDLTLLDFLLWGLIQGNGQQDQNTQNVELLDCVMDAAYEQ